MEPIDIPKEDIKEGIIPKGAITPVDKEDPEPPKNPPIPLKPTTGPSNPRKPDLTPTPNPPNVTDPDNEEMADKGKKPKDYDGTRTKYREWIYGCHMYITANPTKYDTDQAKILLVLSYMREGTVSMFAQRYYFDRELRDWKPTETKLTWGTFKAFLTELAKVFKDEETEQKVRQKLFTMRMGKRTADDFIVDFLITVAESGFNLESTVNYFRQAIHPEILKQVYRLLDMPTTMDDWVKYTQCFDNQWRELQSIKSSILAVTTQQNNPFCYNSSNTPSSMNNSVVPMAVDAVCTPLTNDE